MVENNSTLLESCIVQVDSDSKGLMLLVLNVLIPGTGTILSSFMDSEASFNLIALICGVLQLAMAILVIGWLWSIFHGYAIYVQSC